MKIAAIYKITFKDIPRIYIGSTNNYKLRKCQHIYKLKTNTHENKKIQNYYNKYGKESFQYEVVELLEGYSLEQIRIKEQEYLNKYFAQEYIQSNRKDKRFDELTLNVSPEVNMEIHYWSEERRQKQRDRNKAFIWTEELRKKSRDLRKGIPLSDNHKASQKIAMDKVREKLRKDRSCIYCSSNKIRKCGIRLNVTKNINTQRYFCINCNIRFKIDLV